MALSLNDTNFTIPSLETVSSMALPICQEHIRLRNFLQVTSSSLTSSLVSMTLISLSFPVILLLNIFMIIAFYKNYTLQKKANILLGAMAVNDLLRGGLGAPLFITGEILYQYKLEANCYMTAVFAVVLINVVSELLVTALSCDRFLSVKYPVWHRTNVSKQHFYISIFVSFTVGVGLAIARNFIVEARVPFFVVYIASYLATLIFTLMIWWEISSRTKRMKQKVHGQSALVDSKNTSVQKSIESTGEKGIEKFKVDGEKFGEDDKQSRRPRMEAGVDENELQFGDQLNAIEKPNIYQSAEDEKMSKLSPKDINAEIEIFDLDDQAKAKLGSHPAKNKDNKETSQITSKDGIGFAIVVEDDRAEMASHLAQSTSKLKSKCENLEIEVVVIEEDGNQHTIRTDCKRNTENKEGSGKSVESRGEIFTAHVIVVEQRQHKIYSNLIESTGNKERRTETEADIVENYIKAMGSQVFSNSEIKKDCEKLKSENDTGIENAQIRRKSYKPDIQVHEEQSHFKYPNVMAKKQASEIVIQKQSQSGTKVKQAKQSSTWEIVHRKVVKTTTYLALALLFTRFIPLMLFSAVLVNFDWIHVAVPVVHTMFLANSLVNPLIYGVMNRDIRKACIRLVKCQ